MLGRLRFARWRLRRSVGVFQALLVAHCRDCSPVIRCCLYAFLTVVVRDYQRHGALMCWYRFARKLLPSSLNDLIGRAPV